MGEPKTCLSWITGVSVASVIKVVLAIRVMEPARSATPSPEEKKA